jgi:hypothetical protein
MGDGAMISRSIERLEKGAITAAAILIDTVVLKTQVEDERICDLEVKDKLHNVDQKDALK